MPTPEQRFSVDSLRATVRDLVALMSSNHGDRLRRRPAPGEWSPLTVLAHLADAELVYSVRLRMMITVDCPRLTPYDEKAWADRFGDLDPDPRDTLTRWRALRDANVHLLESLVDDEWHAKAMHAERGEETVASTVARMADHDRQHLDQIRRALT